MKALVVDNSRATRMMLCRTLAELGFQVVKTSNCRKALRIMASQGASMTLALVNWNMPEVNGIEFTRCVRAEPLFDLVKLMMVTTEPDGHQAALAQEAGANAYVTRDNVRASLEDKLRLMGVIR